MQSASPQGVHQARERLAFAATLWQRGSAAKLVRMAPLMQVFYVYVTREIPALIDNWRQQFRQ
ncbi:hypothetical protein O1Q96_17625 [Streptomyces sp. Qhu-G9]|uniref:hypothetical protein n=1 Tax=Streptomyces sp. Qhu-G9 TaxID=3452799 RepID=UPI0022AC3B40|nr:hypothetical protein [Streptomyces aurantiacus]WAU81443.1 hypothetical protein O1Q96_17625 [Streptomyces aurantiacus]